MKQLADAGTGDGCLIGQTVGKWEVYTFLAPVAGRGQFSKTERSLWSKMMLWPIWT